MFTEIIFLTLFSSACTHLGVSLERHKYRYANKGWTYDYISTHTKAFISGFFHPISSTVSIVKGYVN